MKHVTRAFNHRPQPDVGSRDTRSTSAALVASTLQLSTLGTTTNHSASTMYKLCSIMQSIHVGRCPQSLHEGVRSTLCARVALSACVLQSYGTVFRRIFIYVAV